MEVMQLLDRIDALVANGSRNFSGSVIKLDAEELTGLLEDLRGAIADEIRQARQIVREKNTIIGEAQQEADAIREELELNIRTMIDENEITREAAGRAEELLEEAREKSDRIRRGADEYASDVLGKLEQYLDMTLATVREGQSRLSGVLKETAPEDEY